MGNLLLRRRGMMSAQGAGDDYIKGGLVLFLDGLSGLTETSWADKVDPSRTFSLINCAVGQNGGAVFNGISSYGFLENATVSGLTVEACYYCNSSSSSFGVFSQPRRISLLRSAASKVIATLQSGDSTYYDFPMSPISGGFVTLSACNVTVSDRAVKNEVAVVDKARTSFSTNYSTDAYIGCRMASKKDWFFGGTLYALRIYDRLLTEEEMIWNQSIDRTRFS